MLAPCCGAVLVLWSITADSNVSNYLYTGELSHPGQLSLAILLWAGAVTTGRPLRKEDTSILYNRQPLSGVRTAGTLR